jgi:hypothetical protein
MTNICLIHKMKITLNFITVVFFNQKLQKIVLHTIFPTIPQPKTKGPIVWEGYNMIAIQMNKMNKHIS